MNSGSSIRSDPARYGRLAQGFHWLSAVLLTILLLIALIMTRVSDEALKTNLYRVHVAIGLTVLVLTVARLAWRRKDDHPDPLPMPPWEQRLFRGTHLLLYAGVLLSAISGILLLVGSGLVPIPSEVTPEAIDNDLLARTGHMVLGFAFIVLYAAHVTGVLIYQRRVGDALGRMGVGRRRRRHDDA